MKSVNALKDRFYMKKHVYSNQLEEYRWEGETMGVIRVELIVNLYYSTENNVFTRYKYFRHVIHDTAFE